MTHVFHNATEALPVLLRTILDEGETVESRNGTTKELRFTQITLEHPGDGIVSTPGRNVSLPAQIAETMWILAGRNDVKWLSNYLPRAMDFSDDGETWRGGYGPRIRDFGGSDQLAHVVHLLRRNPDTRRAVMSIYDPAIDNHPGKDVPCNNWAHFLPRNGRLDAHIAIRSNDVMWGWSGINTFEWTQILNIVSGLTGLRPGSITFSISSLHLYERHFAKAERLAGETATVAFGRPSSFKPQVRTIEALDDLVRQWFIIEECIRNTEPYQSIRYAIDGFPDPLLRSWLDVLYAWWNDDWNHLWANHKGTALYYAAINSPSRKTSAAASAAEVPPRAPSVNPGGFAAFVADLHADKHAAYGDSWKRRGEMLGIMANIARKVDRLGVNGGGDTAADTAIDLMVYLLKYRLWLSENAGAPRGGFLPASGPLTDDPDHVTTLLALMEGPKGQRFPAATEGELIRELKTYFDALETQVVGQVNDRHHAVEFMADVAYDLAERTWKREQWKAGNATRRFNGYGENDDDK